MHINFTILRGDELRAALRVAPAKVQRYLAASIEIVAREVLTQARTNHRFIARSGSAGLEGKVASRVDRNALIAEVGFTAAAVPYGSFVHDGTRPHKILPKDRKRLRWPGGPGGFIFSKGVNHPGTKPDPFLTDAAHNVDGAGIFARGVDQAIREVFG